VLHFQSAFLQRWDVVTMICLLFTALVTPVEVAFLTTKINALFIVNRVVDVVFVVVSLTRSAPCTLADVTCQLPRACWESQLLEHLFQESVRRWPGHWHDWHHSVTAAL
jgi:hypothetical protein